MGEEAVGPREPLSDNIVVGMPYVAEAAEALANRHGLPPSGKLEEMLDHLFGLACRDQEEKAFDPGQMTERRRRGYALAKSMQKEAAALLVSLERLHRDWNAFDQQVQFKPALLETIFDVDTGNPENTFLPERLSILQSLFRTPYDDIDDTPEKAIKPLDLNALSADAPCPSGFWEAVDRRLQAMAALPIRARLPGGPVANMVVRDAVSSCRLYWTHAKRRWSMASLKNAAVRHENNIANLTSKAERFVADALSTSGVKFNLSELQSAWETIDAAVRRDVKANRAPPKK